MKTRPHLPCCGGEVTTGRWREGTGRGRGQAEDNDEREREDFECVNILRPEEQNPATFPAASRHTFREAEP